MRLEVFLCPVLHNIVVLEWKTGKFDHTIKEVLMAYMVR